MGINRWDARYLSIAKEVSTWSKDPSTKVGAVISDRNGRIVAVGFNGFPKKIGDTMHRRSDRNIKYKMTVHAEANVALIAGPAARKGTLYVHGAPICADCHYSSRHKTSGGYTSLSVKSHFSLFIKPRTKDRLGRTWPNRARNVH